MTIGVIRAKVSASGPIARASMVTAAIRVTGLGVSFAQGVLAARVLGIEGYGIASVALSLANMAATFALFGWGPLAVRKLAQGCPDMTPGFAGAFIRTSGLWVAGMSVLLGGALSAAAMGGLVPEAYRSAVLASGLVVLPMALLHLHRGVAQGLGHFIASQAPIELLRPLLLATVLAVTIVFGRKLAPDIFVLAVASTTVAALVMALVHTLRGQSIDWKAHRDPAVNRQWRSEAQPFLGIMIVGFMLSEITTLLLGFLSSPGEAGLFQPIARMVPIMMLATHAAAVAFAPRIATLWAAGDRRQLERLTHRFTLATFSLTVAIVSLMVVAGPLIMRVFGPDFMPGAALLWIVGLAQVASAAAGPVGHLLSMTGHASTALRGQLVALTGNLCIGIAMVPSYGAEGAAIALAAGLALWNLVLLVRVRSLLGFDPSILGAFRSRFARTETLNKRR